jgi:hypothetical protein
MSKQLDELEDTLFFYSKEIRIMAAEIKRLYQELDLERRQTDMLLDIMAMRNDGIDEKDKWIVMLQTKLNRAVSMLEYSADPREVLDMLTEVAAVEPH